MSPILAKKSFLFKFLLSHHSLGKIQQTYTYIHFYRGRTRERHATVPLHKSCISPILKNSNFYQLLKNNFLHFCEVFYDHPTSDYKYCKSASGFVLTEKEHDTDTRWYRMNRACPRNDTMSYLCKTMFLQLSWISIYSFRLDQ
jgi:hypothetical protein